MGSTGERQRRRILGFVQEFRRCEGYPPSYRDIAEKLGGLLIRAA
jgi:LexA DNA binding domain